MMMMMGLNGTDAKTRSTEQTKYDDMTKSNKLNKSERPEVEGGATTKKKHRSKAYAFDPVQFNPIQSSLSHL